MIWRWLLSAAAVFEASGKGVKPFRVLCCLMENSDEFQELISDSDWEEFGRLVNFEAEDLDVGVLQDLMKILVSKGAY